MIPGGSSEIFGLTFDNKFIPDTATKVRNIKFTDAYSNDGGEFYRYIDRAMTITLPTSGTPYCFATNSLSSTQYGNTSQTYDFSNKFIASVFAEDGTPRFNKQTCNIRVFPSCFELFTRWTTNQSISRLLNWYPFEVLIASADLSTDGIIPGDGFKGYLDTSFIRCALNDYGRLYDDGEWIGFDDCILIKWDKNNTESL